MGITKKERFTEEQNRLSVLFKVLGHPARLAILGYIQQQNSCICTSLVDEIGLAQATISQHLKELKQAGLIRGTIEGKSVCYCIDEEVWVNAKDIINTFLNQTIQLNTCC
ncbi:ArsR/SmtB family transcription factor [Sphingobacterium bovistauri]|uniref:Winged helix-turn-helix transcriptional regulator n=1 Tax=Sphingobacterium bovistauri TaxID=2781959 RepID=A0ABS7Z882_9SPHI|nr:metalloregulator ArsR/SmtB family transcription factor [Sphingobacterium bovistauri]MCA5006403.1 winged helix-turn-helix transcriptional regulator [Sphingobacterium bovistauri]